jgi:hypothetical protein
VSGFPRRDAAHFVRRSEEMVLHRNPAHPIRYPPTPPIKNRDV